MKNFRMHLTACAGGFVGIMVTALVCSEQTGWSAPGPMMDGGMMSGKQMKDMCNMMPGFRPPGFKPENLPEPESRGAKLLSHFCTQCHELPSPPMHSTDEWPSIADRMFARMEMVARRRGMGMMDIENPNPDERKSIVSYLRRYSMRSVAPDQLPLPSSQGARLFIDQCTKCHALPNPKIHTADEWSGVLERMQTNMKSMGKATMTKEDKKVILRYLSEHSRKGGSQ